MDSLYRADQQKDFDKLFQNPTSLYRETPFWAWNCKLDNDELREQIGHLQEMGMGGFHMHSRSGMATHYLSDKFFEHVDNCVDEAKKRGMLAWLYDEDRWPSGAAGGIVTKNPKFRARYLLLRFNPLEQPVDAENDNSGMLLACYLYKLDAEGYLADYRKCEETAEIPAGYKKLWCYRMVSEKSGWYNDQTYVDTLNPKAIAEFIHVTHDAYYERFGKEFDKTIPAIFTDEPQFTAKEPLNFAAEENPVTLPYTDDFPETYRQAYGTEFLDTLPELIWELPGEQYSVHRYRYHDHICERFTVAFSDSVGNWCKEHNLRSTGHMMQEPTLYTQTGWLGEAMRSYRGFLLPGIDTLCDCQEFSTAKQAQSASRQFGRGGVLCELDGVTDWDFDFMGHKGHGDWQAALGITVRVPHLSWVSMNGEAKRDYPASISYQSPWYKKYPLIADHFARVNTAMTRGKAVSHIGVIHPIESYWLLWGPYDQTSTAREQAEENFSNLFQWLLKGLMDFDLLAESLLPIQNVHVEGKTLCVGEMRYETVLVPPTITLRSTTLKILEDFQAAGGKVIFAGDTATLCDAQPSDRAAKLAAKCQRVPYAKAALLKELDPLREIQVLNAFNGQNIDDLLYQMREDADGRRYLFITRIVRLAKVAFCRVRLRGSWQLEFLDTANGDIYPIKATVANGWTSFFVQIPTNGHLLLRMTPATESVGRAIPRFPGDWDEEQTPITTEYLHEHLAGYVAGEKLPVTLDEPNVLPLDMAEWKLNDSDWRPTEEILRLEEMARQEMGMKPKSGRGTQPWVYPVSPTIHGVIQMRFTLHSDVSIEAPMLALEQPERAKFTLDGKEFAFQDCGYWTDKCTRKSLIPAITPGDHQLVITKEYRDDTNIERAFLLGDFGVRVESRRLTLTAPVRELHWGDIVEQGLPFYSGNLTYHTTFELQKNGMLSLRMPSRLESIDTEIKRTRLIAREIPFVAFRATTLDFTLDGKFAGDMAFAPYQLGFGEVQAGTHKLDIKLYGHRYNSFGALHLTHRIHWTGFITWRTQGDEFTYNYRTVPLGIFCEPMLIQK